MDIPFNKPHFTGREALYISESAITGKIAGNGPFTRRCQTFFEEKYGITKTLLTTSCSDALEMAALLLDIAPGDEVIIPSFTFVSTANAFALRGARIVFVDSNTENPNVDVSLIESLITAKTRAIVVVHYGGIACDMEGIMQIAGKYGIPVVEDAAQCIDAFYRDQPLGSIGIMGTLSFHETKNITCGEGGMLMVNDASLVHKAETAWEKGTNRAAFVRGDVEKYEWVALGSSYLPNELTAAFLYGQLENAENIRKDRTKTFYKYFDALTPLEQSGFIGLPVVPEYAVPNGHMFYITTRNTEERNKLLQHLQDRGVQAVFHYLSLHRSPYFQNKHDGRQLPQAERYADTLLRLPFYYGLQQEEIDYIAAMIAQFFKNH
ncbi:MAG: dTDP-4-amino-4,6-dideoxygalactose transaminase [Lentimicrobium sp.]|jgi:dTDP-4-amino-4,6-dideoxygalactose transaminase|nr:dTDP-4-amino-4,6-dideoxygalactose transaminase [Lentimicrobium sp.]